MYPKAGGIGIGIVKVPQKWSTGLCSCTDDWCSCCMTTFCPCVAFGRIAEIANQGTTPCFVCGTFYLLLCVLTCCPWLCSCSNRAILRSNFNLQESPCDDCLVHCFCGPCAICQEYRELEGRGFDMKVGWHENMQRQGKGRMAVPPVFRMTR